MRAYQTIRFIEHPDLGDIGAQGRKSSIGTLRRGAAYTHWTTSVIEFADGTPGPHVDKVCHNDRGCNRSTPKAHTRRHLKRSDRAKSLKFEFEAEEI
jgi:hypothetical protein